MMPAKGASTRKKGSHGCHRKAQKHEVSKCERDVIEGLQGNKSVKSVSLHFS
ncbi:hypothetical protein NIASO_17045 [Niabella soli DSM 19437]|uniref:Uncharacterized protein n=1 Tax=Niabella soli DSM 19437 TaxID=929713 RepID=W0F4J2_9BACT|nr:hypothetical protein NIASO_17045 [Niabella soli DSM 19437]